MRLSISLLVFLLLALRRSTSAQEGPARVPPARREPSCCDAVLDALHTRVRLAVAGGDYGAAQVILGDLERRHGDPERCVSVAPDVLGRGVSLDGEDAERVDGAGTFTVIARDPVRAAAALARVAPRLGRIDEDGHEVGTGVYPPNFVFGVEVCEYGAMVELDTKGVMSSAMGRTMVAIIAGALAEDRVGAHITGCRRDVRWRIWQTPAGA